MAMSESAVTKNGVKAKPMPKKQLQHFEKRLLEERKRVLKELGHYDDAFGSTSEDSGGDLSSYSFHMADQGTDAKEREKAFLYASQEGRFLWHIDEALRRGTARALHVAVQRDAEVTLADVERDEAVRRDRLVGAGHDLHALERCAGQLLAVHEQAVAIEDAEVVGAAAHAEHGDLRTAGGRHLHADTAVVIRDVGHVERDIDAIAAVVLEGDDLRAADRGGQRARQQELIDEAVADEVESGRRDVRAGLARGALTGGPAFAGVAADEGNNRDRGQE